VDGQRAPELAAVLVALRKGAPALRARGVRGLCVVGAVARGQAQPGSGVELLCSFEPSARVSLVGWASLRAELSALVGAPIELAEWDGAADGCGVDAVRAL
jgi:predicted nucleotidyltransferase